jgi:hypothetical protein
MARASFGLVASRALHAGESGRQPTSRPPAAAGGYRTRPRFLDDSSAPNWRMRTWGAPFISRKPWPVPVSRSTAIVNLSVGLKGTYLVKQVTKGNGSDGFGSQEQYINQPLLPSWRPAYAKMDSIQSGNRAQAGWQRGTAPRRSLDELEAVPDRVLSLIGVVQHHVDGLLGHDVGAQRAILQQGVVGIPWQQGRGGSRGSRGAGRVLACPLHSRGGGCPARRSLLSFKAARRISKRPQ